MVMVGVQLIVFVGVKVMVIVGGKVAVFTGVGIGVGLDPQTKAITRFPKLSDT
jgi:hypothetical protein